MGKIHDVLQIKNTVDAFRIKTFIETGTGSGDAVRVMLSYAPDLEIHTIEIFEPIYMSNLPKFERNRNVHLHFGQSSTVLPTILPTLAHPTLFWLDAHYPGADYGYRRYNDEQNKDIRLPLQQELETICANKDITQDVFVMDDLRIYEDGPYQNGNLEVAIGFNRAQAGDDNINFIYPLFESTHHIIKSYKREGFILAFPKSCPLDEVQDSYILA